MRIFTREIITDKPIVIADLADAHYGSVACDKQLIYDVIELILINGWYWTTLGDMQEAITHDDKRFDKRSYDGALFNDKNKYNELFVYHDKFVEMFEPIASQCLGLAKGNHDSKGMFDGLVAKIAETLNTLYLEWTYHLRIRFVHPTGLYEPKLFIKMGEHGYSSARSPGGLYSPLARRLGEFPDVDLLTWAHSHRVHIYPQPVIGASKNPDPKYDDVYAARRRWAVIVPAMCDSYKRNIALYAERKQYPPSDKGLMIYEIDPWLDDEYVTIMPRLAITKIIGAKVEDANKPVTAFNRWVVCPLCKEQTIEATLKYCKLCDKVMCNKCLKEHDCNG